MTTTDLPQLMNAKEVAEVLRTTEVGLRGMRKKGIAPPATKVGGRVLYRRDQLEAWLNERTERSAP